MPGVEEVHVDGVHPRLTRRSSSKQQSINIRYALPPRKDEQRADKRGSNDVDVYIKRLAKGILEKRLRGRCTVESEEVEVWIELLCEFRPHCALESAEAPWMEVFVSRWRNKVEVSHAACGSSSQKYRAPIPRTGPLISFFFHFRQAMCPPQNLKAGPICTQRKYSFGWDRMFVGFNLLKS